jgi:hypothetical protein
MRFFPRQTGRFTDHTDEPEHPSDHPKWWNRFAVGVYCFLVVMGIMLAYRLIEFLVR